MAVKIEFDGTHNVIQPTLVLATRGGKKIGSFPTHGLVFNNSLNEGSQISFDLYKSDCAGAKSDIWANTKDFKLVLVVEWDMYFEISVSMDESDTSIKHVTGMSLGDAELSQKNLYGIEINTEDDISFDDYKPSIFYNEDDSEHSILDRILDGAYGYNIRHVDNSLTTIQRSFSFDKTTVLDAMHSIEEEVHCLFVIDCHTESGRGIVRDVSAFDLDNYCPDCGYRGDFYGECPKCGNTDIIKGYGDDTSIYVSTDNLAENIQDTADPKSVKNCFKLEAGDDLMTAAVVSCDPSGTGYIWNISDDTKDDMSEALSAKLDAYDELYRQYSNEREVQVPQALLTRYNSLVQKYSTSVNTFNEVVSPIVGYQNIMNAYFDTIDLYLYINNSMMPTVSTQSTNAQEQVYSAVGYLSTNIVAVRDIVSATKSSVDSSVLSLLKTVVDPRYQVKIVESSYSSHTWVGKFKVQNYSDDSDVAESPQVTRTITGDYETFINQSIRKAASKYMTTDNPTDISGLFGLEISDFKIELSKYSLVRLKAIHDACQACVDILIQNGIADDGGAAEQQSGLYTKIYLPYYTKLRLIEDEVAKRESDIEVVLGKYDQYGDIETAGMQSFLEDERKKIMDALNFEAFIGEELMTELSSYRRDDVYKNENYISDGLDNSQLFKLAMQFVEEARKEISKASTIQHSFSTSLSNLLVMPEFEPIVDKFEVGNWIRLCSDDNVYRLRLIEYQINFDEFEKISVTFSDAKLSVNGYSDLESILDSASSMATSFNYVARQAKKGSDGNSAIAGWVNNGLSLTQLKIVNDADNQNITWDSHGILCREYEPEFDRYDDRQTKIISRGIYITDDNWRTSRVGVGDFVFYNPKTKQFEESYGVIADTLVGSMVLSEEAGIYNESGSITMDGNGLTITADMTMADVVAPEFTIQRKYLDSGEEVLDRQMYVNTDGELFINGSVRISSGNNDVGVNSIDDMIRGENIKNDVIVRASQLIQDNNRIVMDVFEGYQTKDDASEMISSLQSQIALLSDSFNISISNMRQSFEDADGVLQEKINDITANYRFTSDGQYIGVEGSDAVMRLFNDTLQIIVSDNVATEVNRTGLTAGVANINTLNIGKYTFVYNENDGHLTLT